MTIGDILSEEFGMMFLDDDFFSETIIYVKDGIQKDVRAVVYRNGVKALGQRFDRGADSTQPRYSVEIRISSDPVSGIGSINVREDEVIIGRRYGDVGTSMRVTGITGQDPGTWRLGLQ